VNSRIVALNSLVIFSLRVSRIQNHWYGAARVTVPAGRLRLLTHAVLYLPYHAKTFNTGSPPKFVNR
jgi:hypothetical protein